MSKISGVSKLIYLGQRVFIHCRLKLIMVAEKTTITNNLNILSLYIRRINLQYTMTSYTLHSLPYVATESSIVG